MSIVQGGTRGPAAKPESQLSCTITREFPLGKWELASVTRHPPVHFPLGALRGPVPLWPHTPDLRSRLLLGTSGFAFNLAKQEAGRRGIEAGFRVNSRKNVTEGGSLTHLKMLPKG